MRVLMTGGGTGGHVYPALAIADLIRVNCPDAEIAFVGTEKGIESRLVPKAGYRLYPIRIQGIRRSLSPSNLKTAYLVLVSPLKAKKIIRDFRPDLVIGTGGYVCWPLLRAASSMGIPCMVHESNALPGVAVRQLQKRVDVILTNFAETASLLKERDKVVHVGNPLRAPCGTMRREEARRLLGFADNQFVILSFGGSLGADAINRAALAVWRRVASNEQRLVQVMATGTRFYETVRNCLTESDENGQGRLTVKDYIDDMPTYMAAADAVICRAGAMTLTELAMMKKPSILIPSPNVTDNHQYKNAKVLADAGAAVLIEEGADSEERVCDSVCRMMREKCFCEEMSRKIAAFSEADAGRRIYEEITALLKRKSVSETV